MSKNLAIFGPYPPPLGGISVHISRLETFLKREEISYTIYNHGNKETKNVITTRKKLIWYLKMLFVEPYQIFHFHQFFYFHFFYYWFFSLVRKEEIFVTIHSERLLGYGTFMKFVALAFISKTQRLTLISVSKNLNEWLNSKGISSIYLPAYVPPIDFDKKTIIHEKPLFLFSVWKFNKKLAHEIYNVPIAFEYLRRNKDKYSMLFMIGNKSNSDLLYLEQLIEDYDIKDSVNLIFDENLIDYVNNCVFLLRPNVSDGYGVSLQEALDLGVPAIASDVCERPKGAILFKNNDIDDLSQKIESAMSTPVNVIVKQKETLTYHIQLINLYQSFL